MPLSVNQNSVIYRSTTPQKIDLKPRHSYQCHNNYYSTSDLNNSTQRPERNIEPHSEYWSRNTNSNMISGHDNRNNKAGGQISSNPILKSNSSYKNNSFEHSLLINDKTHEMYPQRELDSRPMGFSHMIRPRYIEQKSTSHSATIKKVSAKPSGHYFNTSIEPIDKPKDENKYAPTIRKDEKRTLDKLAVFLDSYKNNNRKLEYHQRDNSAEYKRMGAPGISAYDDYHLKNTTRFAKYNQQVSTSSAEIKRTANSISGLHTASSLKDSARYDSQAYLNRSPVHIFNNNSVINSTQEYRPQNKDQVVRREDGKVSSPAQDSSNLPTNPVTYNQDHQSKKASQHNQNMNQYYLKVYSPDKPFSKTGKNVNPPIFYEKQLAGENKRTFTPEASPLKSALKKSRSKSRKKVTIAEHRNKQFEVSRWLKDVSTSDHSSLKTDGSCSKNQRALISPHVVESNKSPPQGINAGYHNSQNRPVFINSDHYNVRNTEKSLHLRIKRSD